MAGAASTFTSRDGFFGGDFVNNGPSAENKVEFDDGPFGSRELVWMTVPEVGENADGGWNKTMDGFNNATNNGFMSVVYVRRDSGTASGFFFHGCANSVTNNLDGTANLNPYFSNGLAVSNLPADVWCVAIGIIYASSDANTTPSTLGGIYRLDTGVKFSNSITFRQKSGQTIQQQRVYHSNSTSTTAQLDFAKPGFYVLDGSEPTLSELTAGAAGGDDVFWSANGNDIYNDNTGNVGIGTIDPDALLHVRAATDVTGTIEIQGGKAIVTGVGEVNAELNFGSNDGSITGGIGGSIKSVTEFSNGAKVGIGFYTAQQARTPELKEAMHITNEGKVGIGTSTPVELLYVENPSGDARIGINAPAGSDTEIKFSSADVVQYTIGHDDSTDNLVIGGANVDAPFISIDKSGKVGIGTDSPTEKFVVNGSVNSINQSVNFSTGPYRAVMDIISASKLVRIGSVKGAVTPAGDEGEVAFFVNSLEKVRIDKDGNVGIDNTLPIGKLMVGSNWDAVETNNLFIKESTPISSFDPRVVNTANLGITYATTSNTTTGPDKVGLTLHNNAGVAGQFSPMLIFSSKESGASPFKSATAGIYSRSPLATGASGAWNDGELIFATAGTNSAGIVQRMVINKEGKVGIGTTDPLSNLHIETTLSSAYLRLRRNVTGSKSLLFLGSESLANIIASQGDAVTDAKPLVFKIAVTEKMRIDDTGNVGIGETNPAAKLHVAGGDIRLQKIGIAGDSTFGFYAGNNASTLSDVNYANINTGVTTGNTNSESGFMSFETRNSGTVAERMRIDPTGNVGIGTNNPLARLDVKAPSSDIAGQIIVGGLIDTGTDDVAFGVLNFANINAANTQLNDILASISGEKTDSSNRGELVFSTSNDAAPAERMRIDKDGNVGIGETNPTAPLQVVGIAEYTNNTTALAAGLTAGAFYRTGDDLKVVH